MTKKKTETVLVYVNISDKLFLKLAKAAHAEDITLNQLVTRILEEYIEENK